MNRAIILAGGMGTRFQSPTPKQFVELAGKVLVSYAIEACMLSQSVERVIVVCHKNFITQLRQILESMNISDRKDIDIVVGGESRIASTLLGLSHDNLQLGDTTIILEANRPFVRSEHIDQIYRDFVQTEASCACYFASIKESLFAFESGESPRWVNRSQYGMSQTPYVLSCDAVRDIVKSVSEKGLPDGIDILSFVSPSKKKITVAALWNNFKITEPEDLMVAELLVKNEHGTE